MTMCDSSVCKCASITWRQGMEQLYKNFETVVVDECVKYFVTWISWKHKTVSLYRDSGTSKKQRHGAEVCEHYPSADQDQADQGWT